MGTKKKTHEELVKQINVKVDFADKVYKKMRADRYGITYCCPYDLDGSVLKNNICHWQDIKIDPLLEDVDQYYTSDPVANYCEPPGVYNPTLGICEATVTATTVGSDTFTNAPALPNGTPTNVAPQNNYSYGKDCPVIFDAVSGTDGGGTNPTFITRAWWTQYDATTNGPINQQIPGVTETSLVNALARSPQPTWPNNTTLSFSFPLTVPSTKTYYVFMAADNQFGFATRTGGVTTTHISLSNNSTLMTMVSQANGQTGAAIANLPVKLTPNSCTNRTRAHCPESVDCLSFTRGFLYPVTLEAGCYTFIVSGRNGSGVGMFACAIFDNTKTQIVNATGRSSLTEIFATDTVNQFYSNISADTPYACPPPSTLYTSAPFSSDCPGCRTQTSSTTLECPEGFTLNRDGVCEGTADVCDTETITFKFVNQNGDPMPFYDFIWNGGNLTTDSVGKYVIVIQDASINNNHILNLCHCVTTSGGCAEQSILVTVEDPTVETCVYPDLPCDCTAPALHLKVFTSATSVKLTFQDPNLLNSDNDIVSYVLRWRERTTDNSATWNEVALSVPTLPSIYFSYELTNLVSLKEYEFEIKTKCSDEDSSYGATHYLTPLKPDSINGLIGWWDYTDSTAVYKDLAGTTPVSSDGDLIQRINNKANPTTANAKLGSFLRTIDVSNGPKWKLDSLTGISYGDFAGTGKEYMWGSKLASHGGVVDGSVFGDLTLNNQGLTYFVVFKSGLANPATAYANLLQLDKGPSGSTDSDLLQIQKDGMGSGQGMVQAIFPTDEEINPDTNVTTNLQFYGVVKAPTYSRIYLNGVSQDTGDGPSNTALTYNNGRVAIGGKITGDDGAGITNNANADIYEVIVYNRTLTDTERTSVEDFLKSKYNIS